MQGQRHHCGWSGFNQTTFRPPKKKRSAPDSNSCNALTRLRVVRVVTYDWRFVYMCMCMVLTQYWLDCRAWGHAIFALANMACKYGLQMQMEKITHGANQTTSNMVALTLLCLKIALWWTSCVWFVTIYSQAWKCLPLFCLLGDFTSPFILLNLASTSSEIGFSPCYQKNIPCINVYLSHLCILPSPHLACL